MTHHSSKTVKRGSGTLEAGQPHFSILEDYGEILHMEAIHRHMNDKKVNGNNHNGFTKGKSKAKSCLTSLISLFDDWLGGQGMLFTLTLS